MQQLIENDRHLISTEEWAPCEEEILHVLAAHFSDLVTVISADGTIRYASPSYFSVLGYMPDELPGRHLLDSIPQEDRSHVLQQSGTHAIGMCRMLHADGSVCTFDSVATNQLNNPAIQGIVVSSHDITARVQVERSRLSEEERRFRALVEQTNDLICVIDRMGRFSYVSPSFKQTFGYDPAELLGTKFIELFHPYDLSLASTSFEILLKTTEVLIQMESRVRHADGSWILIEGVGRNCLDDPAIAGIIINARDVTERVMMEEALRHQVRYDNLTNLPNNAYFLETLQQALEVAKRAQRTLALLTLDLDYFKDINDTYGHQIGDVLIQQIGARLSQVVTDPTMIARLGGDEFAILLQPGDEDCARAMVDTLQSMLEKPFLVEQFTIQVRASVGVAIYPAHGEDSLTLLRHADMAMSAAKHTPRGYAFYDRALDHYDPRRLALMTDLRRAIATEELSLYYQPQLDLATNTIASVEALVRWRHPEYGMLPPDQFIALAEQTGLIASLTMWVLEEAVRQCSAWLQAGRPLKISVNLSAWNLEEETLPETIALLLERYAVPAKYLCVELTESAMMRDAELAMAVLTRLSHLGVTISIDDFGTGYSSLSYMNRLPMHELKIDRSFVQGLAEMNANATIVRSTIVLAHSLGLRVVAEGVEDEGTLQQLAALHCDIIQGYHISRPVPLQEFERWLIEQDRREIYATV